MRTIAYGKLAPGMVCEDWDNAGKRIVAVERIERPGFKYDLIKVTFEDRTTTKATPVAKMNVR